MNCTEKCLKNFREDDLTRTEINCLVNCFNKTYRYLAYSNSVYTYLIGGKHVEEYMSGQGDDYIDEKDLEKEKAA